MSQSASRILTSLRDLTGVQGSFLVSEEGELLAEDMGVLFNDELLAEVAPRVIRLCDTFGPEPSAVTSCSISFADHLLFIRPMPGGALCVLSTLDIKIPALKMGVNLILRRLSSVAPKTVPMTAGALMSPTPPPTTTETPPPGLRRWRGLPAPGSGSGSE